MSHCVAKTSIIDYLYVFVTIRAAAFKTRCSLSVKIRLINPNSLTALHFFTFSTTGIRTDEVCAYCLVTLTIWPSNPRYLQRVIFNWCEKLALTGKISSISQQEAPLTLRGQRGRCRNIKGKPQILGNFPSPRSRSLFLWVWLYGEPWQTQAVYHIWSPKFQPLYKYRSGSS